MRKDKCEITAYERANRMKEECAALMF